MKIFVISLFLAGISLYGCNKETNSHTGNRYKIFRSVIRNSSFANAIDTIQAVETDNLTNVKYYYFGDFNSSGEPEIIKKATITNLDTSIYVSFDDSLRVTQYYASINNIRDTVLFRLSYKDDSVTLNRFYYDRITQSTYLKAQIKLKRNNVNSYHAYSSINMRGAGISAFSLSLARKAIAICDLVIIAGSAIVVTGLTGNIIAGAMAGAVAFANSSFFDNFIINAVADETTFTGFINQTPTKPVEKHEFILKFDAKWSWFNSLVPVRQGQQYSIQQITGGWTVDVNSYPLVNADGHTNEAQTPLANLQAYKTLPNAFFGCLLGKLNGQIFRIGANFNGTFQSNGQLEFQINDESRTDNGGFVTIKFKEL